MWQWNVDRLSASSSSPINPKEKRYDKIERVVELSLVP
jgi:hypothetical protein